MIKNRRELLTGISPDAAKRRRMLLEIADFTLNNLSNEKLLKGKISPRDMRGFKRVVVIAFGKAAKSMTKAILPMLGRKPDGVFIADKGHPLPSSEGVRATLKIISAARSLGENDLAVVLVSGGGSAMLAAPVPEITFKDTIRTTQALIKCGAAINEINIVRKHLSQVKGGRLAALLYPATVLGFVISDVVGNDLSTIASGPLSPDPSTFNDALNIIKKYGVKVPARVMNYLEKGRRTEVPETPKPGEKYFKKVHMRIIADHTTVQKIALQKAKKMGLTAVPVHEKITGEARDGAHEFIKKARKNAVRIGVGETTVTCRGKGFGGRNQEFALAGLAHLEPTQTLLSIGTDGIDGICPEKIAGALADTEILARAKSQKLSIKKFLRNNDSYTFFKKTGGLIKTGSTGTNLGDFMLLLS